MEEWHVVAHMMTCGAQMLCVHVCVGERERDSERARERESDQLPRLSSRIQVDIHKLLAQSSLSLGVRFERRLL